MLRREIIGIQKSSGVMYLAPHPKRYAKNIMPTYSVRTVIRWAPRSDQKKKFIYEERITAWNCESIEDAIDLAEKEVKEYADEGAETLDLFQGYWLFDEIDLIPQGTEVFSLLRDSDLESCVYLDTFFDLGAEHQGEYDPEKPNPKQ